MDRIEEANIEVLRYVDDYLILSKEGTSVEWFREELEKKALTLKFTTELALNNELQFLDIRLKGSTSGLCWEFQQRMDKPILPFLSSHTTVIKKGVIMSMFHNACTRSCCHRIDSSLTRQAKRAKEEGYPVEFVQQQIRKVALKLLSGKDNSERSLTEEGTLPVVVIDYYHGISNRLKVLGYDFDVKVVFRFPHKLGNLPKGLLDVAVSCPRAQSTHTAYVQCQKGVVYALPLSCGKLYVGQSGRCINMRVTEHIRGLSKGTSEGKNLNKHVEECGCHPEPEKTSIMLTEKSHQITREICESFLISKFNSAVVSSPTLTLLSAEMDVLNGETKTRMMFLCK